ncbi:hypothetical protein [Anaerococcus hydrogenalis]|uniref:CRISPR-associated protein, Csh1 family n=1 Tax=Anaerococcus hydrogenalis ACS-025-V-Sch4 TaxID=879306 RepID=F0GY22_9FIRM|nr:hypothetical protein [Anaerococcus hydrogenalis]EGC84807.1 hypothetical protein HMPREF9246_1568 [Anaerococcus hydrogenalis ACS-025-V-Sch4]
MLEECLEIFKKNLDEDPDMVLRGYIPKDGKYYLVTMKEEGPWEVSPSFKIKYDKKEKKIENQPLNFSLIKNLDFYSNIINTQKPIDSKKSIHSSNYYSFFFKENSYEDKINKEAIERYFSILKNPLKKYKDKRAKNLYLENEEKLGPVNVEEAEKIEKWLIENIDKKELFDIDENSKDYFKILFIYEDEEKTKKAYQREQDRYLLTNLFNKNKYNIEVGGKTFGVSNDNFGVDMKKPYLENLSRKVKQPYLISMNTAKLQNLFFSYLSSSVKRGNNRIYFNTENMEISFEKNKNFIGFELFLYPEKKEAAILDYNIYSNDFDDIEIQINQYIEEYLPENVKADDFSKREEKYGLVTEKKTLLNKIDSVFFYNYYQRNKYNLENLNIKELNFKMIILNYGKSLEFAIINNKNKEVVRILDRLLDDSIKYSLTNAYNTKAITQFNYYLSLKEYYEKKEENYMDFRENMKRKLESAGDISLEGDEEILFAIGQVLRKLLNNSKIGDKNLSFIRNFLDEQKTSKIIENLKHLLVTYAHNISTKDVRFNMAVSQIMVYEFEKEKTDDKWIIAGFLDESYLYGKKLSEGEENDRA